MKCDKHPSCQTVVTPNLIYHIRRRPKKASNTVSNGSLVNARELEINEKTTVNDLYEMIDLPYGITKHAKVSVLRHGNAYEVGVPVLRIEWRGDDE